MLARLGSAGALVDRHATALFVSSGRALRAVLPALRQRGLAVPDDVSIVGIDVDEVAGVTTPELTRIVRDYVEIGRTAAECLLDRLRAPDAPRRTVTLESHVLLKGSCAAPRKR